jgi:hypothetical protein
MKDDKGLLAAFGNVEIDAWALLHEMSSYGLPKKTSDAMLKLRNSLKAVEKANEQVRINNTLRELLFAAMDDHGVLDDVDVSQAREDVFNHMLQGMKQCGYKVVKE